MAASHVTKVNLEEAYVYIGVRWEDGVRAEEEGTVLSDVVLKKKVKSALGSLFGKSGGDVPFGVVVFHKETQSAVLKAPQSSRVSLLAALPAVPGSVLHVIHISSSLMGLVPMIP